MAGNFGCRAAGFAKFVKGAKMKTRTILTTLFIFTLTLFMTTSAQATCVTLDLVDVGDPVSEAGHNLVSWGPIEPMTSGGHYGGE